ncbi:MAG TPA: site-specific integrase [Burkholderiales bacterium]|nr:site-specific integrase [Burkholderiales bacterium]
MIPSIQKSFSITSQDPDAAQLILWLNEHNHCRNTYDSYHVVIYRFYLWMRTNNLNLKVLSRADILEYIDFLIAPDPSWCGERHHFSSSCWRPFYKPLTIPNAIRNYNIIRLAFKYLYNNNYLLKSPITCKLRLNFPTQSTNYKLLSKKQLLLINTYVENMPQETFLQKFRYETIRWIFALLYYTGCRRSEISNAVMSDIKYSRTGWWLNVIGKGDKPGRVPIPDALFRALLRYRRFLGLSDYPGQHDVRIALIVRSICNYSKVSDEFIYRTVKSVCTGLSVELKMSDPVNSAIFSKVTPHWLRHTSATHQVDAGIDLRVVQQNLRHSSISTTMHYQHTSNDHRFEETNIKFSTRN